MRQPKPETLDFMLAVVCRLHHQRAGALLTGLGLYRGQPPVLRALWEQDGLTHTDLAEQMDVSPATITKMIQRMEKAGFVERRPDPADQRVSRVYLTSVGRAVQEQVEAVFRQLETETYGGFEAEERAVMRRFLKRMIDNLMDCDADLKPCD